METLPVRTPCQRTCPVSDHFEGGPAYYDRATFGERRPVSFRRRHWAAPPWDWSPLLFEWREEVVVHDHDVLDTKAVLNE